MYYSYWWDVMGQRIEPRKLSMFCGKPSSSGLIFRLLTHCARPSFLFSMKKRRGTGSLIQAYFWGMCPPPGSLFATINQQAGSKVFLLPDDPAYEKRLDAYRSKMAEGKAMTLMKKDGDWVCLLLWLLSKSHRFKTCVESAEGVTAWAK